MGITKKALFKFSFIALLLMAMVVAWVGFGERGFIHLFRMEKERQAYLERIRLLEKKNQRLLGEIKRISSDKKYIESVARRDLGLIKDNEILYRFRNGQETDNESETTKKKTR